MVSDCKSLKKKKGIEGEKKEKGKNEEIGGKREKTQKESKKK